MCEGRAVLNIKTKNVYVIYFLFRFFRRQQSRSCLVKPKVNFRDCRHLFTKYQIRKFSLQQGINYLALGCFGKTEEQISEILTPRKEWNRKYIESNIWQNVIFAGSIMIMFVTKDVNGNKPSNGTCLTFRRLKSTIVDVPHR